MDVQIANCGKMIDQKTKAEWTVIDQDMTTMQHARNRAIVKQIHETTEGFKESL